LLQACCKAGVRSLGIMGKRGTGRWANLASIFAQNLILIAVAIATVGFVFVWLKNH
jgi:hypothetical protein